MTEPIKPPIRYLCPLVAWGTLAIGIYVASSTIFMAASNWEPVPYMDQWDQLASLHGSWSWLISQFSEHRILFPRLIFVADFWLFGETNVLNFAVNVFAQGALVLLLVALGNGSKLQTSTRIPWLVGLNLSFLFWAAQYENFAWGLNVAFFLAPLVAASAFAVMALLRPTVWSLTLVLILEAIAVYTMANGMLVPFLMIPLAMFLGRPRSHVFVLVVFAIGLLGSYLVGYHTPYDDPAQAWRRAGPIMFFTLADLGSPFGAALRAVFGANRFVVATGLAGLAIIFLAAIGWRLIRQPAASTPRELVLLTLACFAFGTALLTAMGRAVSIGIDYAFTPRYFTAALLFWSCLIVLGANLAHRSLAQYSVVLIASTLPFLFVVLISQPIYILIAEGWVNGRHVAVPALLSGVNDRALLGNLGGIPLPEMLKQGERLKKARASIFADEWGHWLGTRIEDHLTLADPGRCEGGFDSTEEVAATTNPRGWRAYGHAWDSSRRRPVEKIMFAGGDGNIIGFGVDDRGPHAGLASDLARLARVSGTVRAWSSQTNAWIGDFASDDPTVVRAYGVVGRYACSLGRPQQVVPLPRLEVLPEGTPLPSPGGLVNHIGIDDHTVLIDGWGMLSPVRANQRVHIDTNLPVSSAYIDVVPRRDVVDALNDEGLAKSGIKIELALNEGEMPAKIKLCLITTDSRYGSHVLQIPSQPELCPAAGAPSLGFPQEVAGPSKLEVLIKAAALPLPILWKIFEEILGKQFVLFLMAGAVAGAACIGARLIFNIEAIEQSASQKALALASQTESEPSVGRCSERP